MFRVNSGSNVRDPEISVCKIDHNVIRCLKRDHQRILVIDLELESPLS